MIQYGISLKMSFSHSQALELELMGNSRIGIAYLKKMEMELINLELELKFAKKINPQIKVSFYFLTQKYFFHDSPTWNIYYLV